MRAAFELIQLKCFTTSAVVLLAATTSCTFASSEGEGLPSFMMKVDVSGDIESPMLFNPDDFASKATAFGNWALGTPGPDRQANGWRYRGDLNDVTTMWDLDWNSVVNPDPFIDATINVTNTTATVQEYAIFMTLVLSESISPSTLMRGSVSLALSDQGDAQGATFAASSSGGEFGNGMPVYQAYIDPEGPNPDEDYDSIVRTMWDNGNPGFSAFAAQGQAAGATDDFDNEFGPAAINSIAIQIRFTLTPGDSASVTAIFEIVPGPGGLALFALGGLMCRRHRRRST